MSPLDLPNPSRLLLVPTGRGVLSAASGLAFGEGQVRTTRRDMGGWLKFNMQSAADK